MALTFLVPETKPLSEDLEITSLSIQVTVTITESQ